MWLEELWNQVHAAYFCSIFSNFGCEHVHGSLNRCGRFWSACTTVSNYRGGVGGN